MVNEYVSKSREDTLEIAKSFAKTISVGDIVLLDGDLGAGKTVFVKGVTDYFSKGKMIAISPTFMIVNVYDTEPEIYHFDLYRIDDVEELDSIGAEEYLFGNGISFVEWPERAKGYFPKSAIKVEIKKLSENERLIRIDNNE
ncbi:MAG: tRNA (adenosine(37)-N6)-threonylcarbamoyltransferase complex ATPase subunit type 1 TsaE [Clostridia bacterium]|nr:tRNA (adenosine(37)-N6)-threonylcarbamoyltransferase complex ATPase subunit type 1 TsaE [Clostridia bacterium]